MINKFVDLRLNQIVKDIMAMAFDVFFYNHNFPKKYVLNKGKIVRNVEFLIGLRS